MHRDELAAWLRLLESPRIGRDSARRLLAAFGSPEAVFTATQTAHREVVGQAAAEGLRQAPDSFTAVLDQTLAWLQGGSGPTRDVIPLGHGAYPKLLLETADPPLLLYAQGDLALLNRPSLAIVGSRNPTPQGLANAQAFASHLSDAGLTILSGLALGIDAAAHLGGLTGAGRTVAVVGTGLDRVYPRGNLKLAHRIAEQGLLLSEFAPGTPPMAANFPMRNRIIAGVSLGTLVVEAALQSGSLITARLAAEAGREVFAIPGSIHSPQSRGCHTLIKQGAKLVDGATDILEELKWVSAGAPAAGKSGRAPAASAETTSAGAQTTDPLLVALGYDPVSLDALTARTGWPASELSARLLELEMAGLVARLPGQLFQRIAQG